MMTYLSCMKKVKGMNDPECRDLAKSYLACRMDRCGKYHYAVRGYFVNGMMQESYGQG
jgi:cytochrome c oxidase assembly protein subunit 19